MHVTEKNSLSASRGSRSLILPIVLLVITTFQSLLPPMSRISIGIGSVSILDCLFLYLLVSTIPNWYRENAEGRLKTPMNKFVLLFCLSIMLSVLVSKLLLDGDWWLIRREMRCLFYYFFFFIILPRLRSERQISLMAKAMIFMGLFSSVCSVCYGLFDIVPLPWHVSFDSSSVSDMEDIARVGFPGGEYIFVGFVLIITLLVLGEDQINRSLYISIAFFMIIALILALTRNFWISITASLTVFFLILPSAGKAKMIKWAICIVLVCTFIFIPAAMMSQRVSNYATAFSGRFATIFTKELWEESDTMVDRYKEVDLALVKLRSNPFLGIGLGNPYRDKWYPKDVGMYTLHNAYVHIWLYLGLPGLVSFLMMSTAFLWRVIRNWRRIEEQVPRAIVIGCGVSYFGMMITNWVAPFFIQSPSLAIFPLMMALSERVLKLEELKCKAIEVPSATPSNKGGFK